MEETNRLLAEEDPQRAQQSEIASHEINEQYIASPSFERIFHTGNEQPEVEWLIRQAKKGWTWTLLLTLAEIGIFLMFPFFYDQKRFPSYQKGQYYLLVSLVIFTLFGWGYALCVRIWLKTRINYAKVLGLRGRYILFRGGVARLCAMLAAFQLLTTAIFFGITWRFPQERSDGGIASLLLLITLLAHIGFFVAPQLPYVESRYFLRRTLLRCLSTPFCYEFTFVDSVVADLLTSAGTALYRLQYGICTVALTLWDTQEFAEEKCGGEESLYKQIAVPLAAAFPFWLRFVQCVSQYVYALSQKKRGWQAHQHLVNAFKYVSALAVVGTNALNFYHGSSRKGKGPYGNVWLVAVVVKMLYCYIWDIVMDWGLCQTSSGLRPTMLFAGKKWYYIAMVTNGFGRLSWAFGISPHQYPEEWSWLLQTIEVFRRIQWLVFRVENEYISGNKQDTLDKEDEGKI